MTAVIDERNRSTEEGAGFVRFSEARLPTGVTLRYAEQGAADGQPVIFLHGYTDSWFSFSPVLPYFDSTYRVFALSQRGHGDSEQPASGYAITDFAADVLAFMDALKLESAVLVGHSMGSFVAQQVVCAAPRRVTKLVLVGSATIARNEGLFELQRAIEALEDPVPAAFAREFQESTIYQPLPEEFVERVVRESLKLPARVWRAVLDAHLEFERKPLERISVPTLILWGDRDAIFQRAEQEELQRTLQNGVLKIYRETGHALHWERPVEFAGDVKSFIYGAEPGEA